MTFASEQQVKDLAELLRGPLALPALRAPPPIDNQLISFADFRHRIGPMLFKASGSDEHMTQDNACRERLQDIYSFNTQRILRQKAAAKKLSDLLAAHDTSCILLKGSGLAAQLYDDVAIRQSRDVDILIKPETSVAALSTLYENGYLPAGKSKKINMIRDRLQLRISKDVAIRDPDFDQLIELHRRAIYFEPANYTDDLIDALGDISVPPISNSHYFFYLVLHGALSFWQRLHWLADLSMLVRKTSPTQRTEIIELAKYYRCQLAIKASLFLVEEIFPGSLDDQWQTLLKDDANHPGVTGLQNMFRSALFGNAPKNPLKAGSKKTGFQGVSRYIFPETTSFAGMLPRRIASYILSKI